MRQLSGWYRQRKDPTWTFLYLAIFVISVPILQLTHPKLFLFAALQLAFDILLSPLFLIVLSAPNFQLMHPKLFLFAALQVVFDILLSQVFCLWLFLSLVYPLTVSLVFSLAVPSTAVLSAFVAFFCGLSVVHFAFEGAFFSCHLLSKPRLLHPKSSLSFFFLAVFYRVQSLDKWIAEVGTLTQPLGWLLLLPSEIYTFVAYKWKHY
mmetsp:Transcript_4936/g.7253  ORF Transcript_4936/g.7253 Transcript_4936/m.7253 type:complete len:207 (-) Transcript_4936:2727-3347(-)